MLGPSRRADQSSDLHCKLLSGPSVRGHVDSQEHSSEPGLTAFPSPGSHSPRLCILLTYSFTVAPTSAASTSSLPLRFAVWGCHFIPQVSAASLEAVRMR